MSSDRRADWAGVPVLVTGAGGFIGSHLVEALAAAGASVRAFVRYNARNDFGHLEDIAPSLLTEVDVFTGDLANPEAVANAAEGREVVFHLGALIPIPYSYRHPREFVESNVVATLNVLEADRRGGGARRIVHTSTSEVYGTAQSVPISEDHPLHPQSPYAATKVGADQLALTFHLSFGTPAVVVRPFNTYGPRQSARAVLPTIISQALSRDRIELGSLEPTRDLLFVADTVAGMMAAGNADGVEGEVINLGTGSEIAIGELAKRVLALLELELPVVSTDERLRPPDSEVERLVADPRKAERLLGWKAEVGLDEGIERTIEWIRGSLAAYKPDVYNV
jgi:NAD dependent epimerase/dehydratase